MRSKGFSVRLLYIHVFVVLKKARKVQTILGTFFRQLQHVKSWSEHFIKEWQTTSTTRKERGGLAAIVLVPAQTSDTSSNDSEVDERGGEGGFERQR